MKNFFWVLAVVVGCLGGFYVGFNRGSQTMATLAAQNEVSDAISLTRTSLNALSTTDIGLSTRLHESNLELALVQLGAYSKSVEKFWPCSDQDQSTMQAARTLFYRPSIPTFRSASPQVTWP